MAPLTKRDRRRDWGQRRCTRHLTALRRRTGRRFSVPRPVDGIASEEGRSTNAGRARSARRPLAVVIAARLGSLLARSCVVTSGLHVVATPNVTNFYMGALPDVHDALTAVSAVSPSNVWADMASTTRACAPGPVRRFSTKRWRTAR